MSNTPRFAGSEDGTMTTDSDPAVDRTVGEKRATGRWFFIHVMKTGGATFRRQLVNNFGAGAVYPVPGVDTDLRQANYSLDYLRNIGPERHRATRAYAGHFPFVAVELVGEPLRTMTILRHPVERTISYLKHCKVYHAQHRHLCLEAIYEDPFFYRCFIENHQAKLFAFTSNDRPASYMDPLDIDGDRLKIAKSNLDRVDVVGLQENFVDFLGVLRSDFGWRIADVESRHVTPLATVSASFRRRIASDNDADLAFYEYAARRSHEPCR
jgi:hypothetical protein